MGPYAGVTVSRRYCHLSEEIIILSVRGAVKYSWKMSRCHDERIDVLEVLYEQHPDMKQIGLTTFL